ncbi:MAG: response regulator [Anaerolineales bacterium]|nr:response regulator [Anaerolineales bacterium]
MQTVLVISKDEEMLNVWNTFFKEKNYQVINENEVKNSIQTSRLLTPALIILDLDLPQNEQIQFCHDLRSTTNGALLLLAPQNREVQMADYYQAGVSEFIATPVNPMAVLIKSITWLARQEWIVPRGQPAQMYM